MSEQVENEEQLELPTEPAQPEVDPKLAELQSKYERLAGLEPYVNEAGGVDALVNYARLGSRVSTDPALMEALRSALAPKAPEPEPEEEIYDPEVKTVNDKFTAKMRELEERNARLESELSTISIERYREKVGEHMEKVLGVFKDDKDLFEEAKTALDRALSSASQTQLQELHRPDGVKTMKMMLIDQYEKLFEKRNRVPEPTEASVLSKATDSRQQTRASLPANTVGVRSGTKITPQITQKIMEEVSAKLGKDPKALWN